MSRDRNVNSAVAGLAIALCFIVLVWAAAETTAQTIYDMSEINGDLKILGKSTNSYTSQMAILDFNEDGKNDFFVSDGKNHAVYGFLAGDLVGVPNKFWDLLDQPYNFEIRSPTGVSSSSFGRALVSGDWNNDGMPDLAISDPSVYVPGEIEHGQVYVLFGRSSWQPGMVINLDNTPADVTIHHNIPGHLMWFGNCLATGDVNGDGIDDLAIGAPYCGNPEGFGTGAAFVLYGSDFFTAPMLLDLSDEPADLSLYGERAGDKFGSDVAVGDVNGDGKDDLVIGAWDAAYSAQKRGGPMSSMDRTSFPRITPSCSTTRSLT